MRKNYTCKISTQENTLFEDCCICSQRITAMSIICTLWSFRNKMVIEQVFSPPYLFVKILPFLLQWHFLWQWLVRHLDDMLHCLLAPGHQASSPNHWAHGYLETCIYFFSFLVGHVCTIAPKVLIFSHTWYWCMNTVALLIKFEQNNVSLNLVCSRSKKVCDTMLELDAPNVWITVQVAIFFLGKCYQFFNKKTPHLMHFDVYFSTFLKIVIFCNLLRIIWSRIF